MPRPDAAPWTATPPAFGWPGAAPLRYAARARFADRYLLMLGLTLLGYALLGRAFAYVGVPPLYVGEVVLALGLVALAGERSLRGVLELGPMPVLGVLMAWVAVRTIPYLGRYGLDAARDAMLVGYGLFAFVVVGLLLARPERLRALVVRYRVLVGVVLTAGWVVYLVAKLAYDAVPALPWADGVKVVEAKAGDLLVHLAAITAFLLVGLGRRRPVLLGLLAISVALTVVSTRGGMAAYGLGLAAAWLLRPPTARVGRLAYAFAALLAVGALVGPALAVNDGTRDVSVEQLWQNVTSVFSSAGTETLDGSKRWRVLWWTAIWDYTVEGPYFWTGKGFGINLAEADGFSVSDDASLRSPHNGHLTMLARAGVPGFVLWVVLHLAWLAAVLRAWRAARRLNQVAWMGFFAAVVAFVAAACVNGAFDVYLEGPMGGIWFWVVWGVGLAGARLQATHPDLLERLDGEPEGGSAPVPPRAWGWPARGAPVPAPVAVREAAVAAAE